MDIPRRALLGALALATAPNVQPRERKQTEERRQTQIQLIDHWIVKHGGDCCGCAVSDAEGKITCNECGETLDVLVSEVAFNRMAEALQRAHHALASSSGLQVNDGKPEHSFTLDHSKELRFLEEALKLADVDPRPLHPLA